MYSFEEGPGSSASRGDEDPPTFALTSTAIKRKKQEGGSSGSRSEQEFDTLVGLPDVRYPDELPKKRPVGRPRGSGKKKSYSQLHQDIQQQQQQQERSTPISIPTPQEPDYIAPLVNKKMEDLERRRSEKVENDKKKYNFPKDAAPKVAWDEGVTGGDDEEDKERSRLYKDVEDNHRLWPHLKEGCKKKLTPRSSVRDLEDELQRCQNVKKTDKALMAMKAFDIFSAKVTEYVLYDCLNWRDAEGLGELAEATQGACEDTLKELAVKYRDRLSMSPEVAYLFFSAMRLRMVMKANKERRQERAPPAADYAKANLQGYEDL